MDTALLLKWCFDMAKLCCNLAILVVVVVLRVFFINNTQYMYSTVNAAYTRKKGTDNNYTDYRTKIQR